MMNILLSTGVCATGMKNFSDALVQVLSSILALFRPDCVEVACRKTLWSRLVPKSFAKVQFMTFYRCLAYSDGQLEPPNGASSSRPRQNSQAGDDGEASAAASKGPSSCRKVRT